MNSTETTYHADWASAYCAAVVAANNNNAQDAAAAGAS